jgi:hypothetical protein
MTPDSQKIAGEAARPLDERIAEAEAAGDWPTASALNAQKLAKLAHEDAVANARRLGSTPVQQAASDPAQQPAGPALDEQIAEAAAQHEWQRLNDLNAQKLAGLVAQADANADGAGFIADVIGERRSFRLHTELDPKNPAHAAALAEVDRAKTSARLIEVYQRQRAKDRRRDQGDLARFLP